MVTTIENGYLICYCEDCTVGKMNATTPIDAETILPSSYVKKMDLNRRYLHQCDVCGKLEYYEMEYPVSMFIKRYI